jgi:hypothetical protein
VLIEKTTGISRAGWLLESGITLHNSKIAINNCRIVNSAADNALRLSNSEFTISNCNFSDLSGDAIDAEFSQGEVKNTTFKNIQAEAIDTESTTLQVLNSQFQNIGDKAISAGQGSIVKLSNLAIKGVGMAIASLDSAQVELENVAIKNAKQAGLIAYQARSEWGSANITAQRVSFAETKTKTLVEAGSWIELDGRRIEGIPTEEFWAQVDRKQNDD